MTANVITLIHQVELNIFKEFARIAKNLNIHYLALGGTLLGAVRHQGFIPWDDDMDIGILREDYERFLDTAPSQLSPHFFLQTPWTDPNYALSYAKLLDRTTYIEEKNNVNNARKGVFLDIFPLDKIPASRERQRRQIVSLRRLDSRIYLKLRYNVIDNPMRKFQTPLSNEQLQTAWEYKRQRQDLMTNYNERPNLMTYKNLASQYSYDKEVFSKEQLNDLIDLPFEDTVIAAPADYDQILTNLYGDYLTLPPANARVEKHITRLIMDNQEFMI